MVINYIKDWNTMEIPTVKDLQGEFKVTILSGVFKAIAPFIKDWRKSITNHEGYNLTNKNKVGLFKLEYTSQLMNLEYSAYPEQKPRYWRRLRDEMRIATPDVFVGRIWFQDYWAPRFLGFFSLTRIAEISKDEVLLLSTWRADFPQLIMHLIQLWEFTESSYIAHTAGTIEMAVGLSHRNAQIIETLKTNKEFWNCHVSAIDDIGFYRFKIQKEAGIFYGNLLKLHTGTIEEIQS